MSVNKTQKKNDTSSGSSEDRPSPMEFDFTMDPLNMSQSWAGFWENVAQNPQDYKESLNQYFQDYMELIARAQKKLMGEEVEDLIDSEPGDRRFKADEWQNNVWFNFIKQSYLLNSRWSEQQLQKAKDLNDDEKEKLLFSARLLSSAFSPTNFALTNPDVLRETIDTKGANLIKGLENLRDDLKAGQGMLKIRTTPDGAFKVGENIACTKGAVVYENELMQLIHYAPLSDKTHETPLLIIPPWINKYYILDLKPENSLVRYALEQGQSVFMLSWVNPDASLGHIDFEDYLSKGILEALDKIKKTSKQESINAVGYCLGGTLLAGALSYLKTHKRSKDVSSATFLTTLLDFKKAGDLKLFLGEEQIKALEDIMKSDGVFSAKQLQQTFALLRSNDLIWSFVVNNYLMGKEPFPFDLLYWNDDSTNIPATMQSFYLRNMYRDNHYKDAGKVTLLDTPIDISQIETPCYFLSAREDHIAPWLATYDGAKIVAKGNKNLRFTLAASGHIAGVINPPAKNKYCYWTNDKLPSNSEDWLENAIAHDGSWWGDWSTWLKAYSGKKVAALKPTKALEPAPGSYVQKRA